MKSILKSFAISVALLSGSVNAEENKFWVSPGFVSHHFDRSQNFNEVNPGLAVEYEVNRDWSVAAGTYKNSERRQSTYVSGVYRPLKLDRLSFGVTGGLVTGYDVPVAIMAAPVMTYTADRVSVDMLVIPDIKYGSARVYGALAFQIKFLVE